MIQITLHQVSVTVQRGESPAGPVKVMNLVDPQSGIVVTVPFDIQGEAAFLEQWHGLTLIHLPDNGAPPKHEKEQR